MAAVALISTRNGNSRLCCSTMMMRFRPTRSTGTSISITSKGPRSRLLSSSSTLPSSSSWNNKGTSGAATSAAGLNTNSWFVESQTIFSAKREPQQQRLFHTTSRRYHSTATFDPVLPLPHDLGGNMSAYGPIPATETLVLWEQQCHSMLILLSAKQILKTDEVRRSIESLTPQQSKEWSYYEKWSAAMTNLLLEKKILTHDELQRALWGGGEGGEDAPQPVEEDAPPPPPRFQVGDSVRVKRYHDVQNEWKRPHIRTPGYVYGVAGTIERICGRHGDPSYLAFGLHAPLRQLYRIRFRMQDLWPEQYHDHDQHGHDNVVEVEVYDHWLEPTDTSTGHDFEPQVLFNHKGGEGADCGMHHDHDHSDGHVHEKRPLVEERAIQREGPPRPGQELFQTLLRLLSDKGIVSASEIREVAERMDTAGKQLDGATLVVNAWMDPSFQERLLADPTAAASELGISTANPNAPTVLTIVANTPTTHNLIVCTLCSCYPAGLLGIAPSWYKSREYRARAVREPRNVLTEFGLQMDKPQIRVHDSTADHRYLVLPERPAGTEGWSKEELRTLATRDTMLGVAVPSVPVPKAAATTTTTLE